MGSYTFEEIISQPDSWKKLLSRRNEIELFAEANKMMFSCSHFIFIGCGTSFYLALSAANLFSKMTGINSKAVTASDILLFSESILSPVDGDTMCIIISRSGTTTEGIWAAEKVKKIKGVHTCAVSCRPESELVKKCDSSFVIQEADEKSVVMTRSFTTMLLFIQLLAGVVAQSQSYLKSLSNLPDFGSQLIQKNRSLIDETLQQFLINHFVYLGQGPCYGLASESMLKVKEMSLTISEAYHTLEYRHGPMSLVHEGMLIGFMLSDAGYKDEILVLKEMKELGARTMVICDKSSPKIIQHADVVFELQSDLSDYSRLILYLPITQLFGYYQAMNKRLNPDAPKNLTQVVKIQ